MNNRLVIASNRLPITVKMEHGDVLLSQSSGGLATGLRPFHEKTDSLWIGWPGDISRFDATQRAQLGQRLSELRTIPVHLTQTEISRYYEGFSNGVFWPLFHYLTDIVERGAWRNWETYKDVNKKFAEAIAANYRPGDLVWIHDYHLALVPRLVRRLIPKASIGFFLHIPFPSSEVFRILPWRSEVLKGILGADVIGFHTYSYLTHFSRALLHVLSLEVDSERLRFDDREVRLGVFPMSIDAEEFARLAQDPSVEAEVESIRANSEGRKLLVGVDRLDHTKGLSHRMLAIERLFEREPALRKTVRMIQVVVPSRTRVASYEGLRRQLDELVGRINGAYTTVKSVPIHYLYRSITQRELVALYRAADVMLVTPIRDGMNLVAKEFVASRVDEGGVLVLSEFAGAAAELVEALHVNPYDLDRIATAIKEALIMPDDQRRARMRALRRRVHGYDVHRWSEAFINAMSASVGVIQPANTLSPPEAMAKVTLRLQTARRLLLLLDYDGTLVPFASTPDLAAPDNELRKLLGRLAERPGTSVHVLSGRARATLDRWLGDLRIGLHAEHGFWSKTGSSPRWQSLGDYDLSWKPEVMSLVENFTLGTPGSLIEEKTAGLAWHYRMADPELGAIQARELNQMLSTKTSDLPIDVLVGDKVVEIRGKGINKGVIASRLISELNEPTTILAMGDDQTDEDLFSALNKDCIAVHVGPRPSGAAYRIADPAGTRALLASLLDTHEIAAVRRRSPADRKVAPSTARPGATSDAAGESI